MLGTSLAAVAAFAGLTFYLIAGDEIKANRNQAANNSQPQKTPIEPTPTKPETTQGDEKFTPTKPAQRRTRTTKTEVSKIETIPDPIAVASSVILAHIKAKGPMTINKLSQELKIPKETVVLAGEKLVADNACVTVKRGGYPGLALV